MKGNLTSLLSELELSLQSNEKENFIEVLKELLDLLDYCSKEELLSILFILNKYRNHPYIHDIANIESKRIKIWKENKLP